MPLIPEKYEVQELLEYLKSVGWEDGKKYGLKEHTLLDTIIHYDVFEKKFKEINEPQLRDLDKAEIKDVLDQAKNILKSSTEEKILEYIKHGIEITIKREKRLFRLIDYENLENDVFYYANELKFPGKENVKPDVTLFVNGIPLAIIEAKASTKLVLDLETETVESPVDEALRQIGRYEIQSPELFRFVQLAIAYADKKLFVPTIPNWDKKRKPITPQPWKVKKKENGKTVKVEDIHDLLKPETLLNVIKWFTFFRGREKIIARYNQYIATEEAVNRISEYLSGGEKNRGLIWHWQGSGKTYTMFFIANKFFEMFFERSPLIFFVVDRKDLQRQLKEFLDEIEAPKFKRYLKIVNNIDELKELVREIKRSEYRFTISRGIYIVLIQKFRREDFESLLIELGEEYLRETNPKELERIKSLDPDKAKRELIKYGGIQKKEVLLLIDEAHRSQYGLLASMMKNVFPNAIRFAFTGTPVFKFERNTFLEFAYPPKELYLDVYFIKDSISDGFTLPIVYDVIREKGEIKILLSDEDIRRFVESWIKACESGSIADDVEEILDERVVITKGEIRKHINKAKSILTNKERLKKLAEYIAERIDEDTENFRFKAMVVLANRKACVIFKRFFDEELAKRFGKESKNWTEIVMTYQHNDTCEILKYKEELAERRGKRDYEEINAEIQDEFKNKENPKVLIVTDMLITGFDAPKLKVMYLDKPLYEHRLLQAIARVNRPYEGKKFGLIVDSVGLLNYVKESLRKYNLIAEGEIASDIEENLLKKIDEKFENFKELLENIKNTLKSLRIEDKDLSIDVDEIRKTLKDKREAFRFLREVVEPKIKIIALFWDRAEIQRIINGLKEVIQLFKALGSHRDKIHYIEEVDILTFIYYRILYHIKGRRVPKEFWDELIELIHDKTIVEGFEELSKTKIPAEEIIERLSAKLVSDETIGDAYSIAINLLSLEPANPVHKEIWRRIESVRRDWVARRSEFITILAEAIREKLEYDKSVRSKPVEERIVETVKLLILRRFGKSISVEGFKRKVSEISSNILEKHKREIQKALMMDIFKQAKDIPPKDVAEFVREVSDYVIEELRRSKGES